MAEMHDSTKEMFLRKAIEKILAEKEIKKSVNAQLKKACEVCLEELDAVVDPNNDTSSTVVPSAAHSLQGDKYFLPFELACASKSPKIIVIALDTLQKMIAYGHLTGSTQDTLNPKRLLIDRIVEAICDCFTGPTTNETVQLQIVKALLTVVTSKDCEVHEASLLKAVRTTFNIHLASKSTVNQATANGALTQMLRQVFARMEAVSDKLCFQEETTSNAMELAAGDADVDPDVIALVETLINRVDYDESSALQMTESNWPAEQAEGSGKETPNFMRSTSAADSFDTDSQGGQLSPQHQAYFNHVLLKDCYLLFRALCRLSSKPIPENSDARSMEYRSKVVSLRLLLSILQDPGACFRNHRVFRDAIRQYLCMSLSKNGASPILDVFELSLSIFVSLLQHFKAHLKIQIEVLFREIFLNILESPTSPFDHKWLVIQAVSTICSDAQSIVELYINYDCDMTATNIFQRLVVDIEKLAQGRYNTELANADKTHAGPNARTVQLKGLQSLTGILKCMVEFSRELYVSPRNMVEDEQSTVENDATKIPNQNDSAAHDLEQVKQQKDIMEAGIELFNRKPVAGIKFLQDRNLIASDPCGVAEFLHVEERLDKAVVGDFLGDGSAYCKDVMYEYVDQMDFRGKTFLAALRLFLEAFRLPGEAQKIDRLMEKFASRFCENNPDHEPRFASADTAYVLAYSIIMLTTDLHSSQVKHKMTEEQYIHMNRGINDSEDLDATFLSAIYREIKEEEIKMKPHSTTKLGTQKTQVAASEKQRRLVSNMEMQQMAATAKSLMEAAAHAQAPFTPANNCEHVRPMFKLVWRPCLAAFSIQLQNTEDPEVALQCLEGFRCAIRVACIFQLNMERDAFVQALSRFTLLTANSALSEMKAKNIDTIKTLMSVAHSDGNYLGESWLEILRCVSQLELAQLIGTGVKTKYLQQQGGSHRGSTMSLASRGGDSTASTAGVLTSLSHVFAGERRTPESLNETSSQSIIVAVDRIFTGSVTLDGSGIVHFVRALCQVSQEELSSPTQPRMFSLQKLVEISYYNMGRIRLQWSRVWSILGPHFNQAGNDGNEDVANFAVDSLRQLSVKFIERGELRNFRFQKDFLRPFEYIMKHNPSAMIRDMVVRCMAFIVHQQTNQVRSGWKNIFAVFHMAAGDTEADIVSLSFQTTSFVVDTVFASNLTSTIDSFQEAVKTLAEFACNPLNPDMSMEAIDLIRKCANYVATRSNLFIEHQWEDYTVHEDERIWMRGWFPILFEMSCIVNRCSLDVRTRALSEMFVIMKTHGGGFKPAWWKELLAVCFRIFDVMKLPEKQSEKAEWLMTTCNHALLSIVDVFSHYYEQLHGVVLEDLYERIQWCVMQDNEQLARSGIECLGTLVASNGKRFDASIWESTTQLIVNIFRLTTPSALLEWSAQSTDRERTDALLVALRIRANVQTELIQTVDQVLFGVGASRRDDERSAFISKPRPKSVSSPVNGHSGLPSPSTLSGSDVLSSPEDDHPSGMFTLLSTSQLFVLVNCLMDAHDLARKFNSNQAQRTALWKAGFSGPDKPNLYAQERCSITCALRILFRMTAISKSPQAQARLLQVCDNALSYFESLEGEQARDTWTPVILLILSHLLSLPPAQFASHMQSYKTALARLIAVCSNAPMLCAGLSRVFERYTDEFDNAKSVPAPTVAETNHV